MNYKSLCVLALVVGCAFAAPAKDDATQGENLQHLDKKHNETSLTDESGNKTKTSRALSDMGNMMHMLPPKNESKPGNLTHPAMGSNDESQMTRRAAEDKSKSGAAKNETNGHTLHEGQMMENATHHKGQLMENATHHEADMMHSESSGQEHNRSRREAVKKLVSGKNATEAEKLPELGEKKKLDNETGPFATPSGAAKQRRDAEEMKATTELPMNATKPMNATEIPEQAEGDDEMDAFLSSEGFFNFTSTPPPKFNLTTALPKRGERDAEKGNMTEPATELPKNATTARPKQRRDAEDDHLNTTTVLPLNMTTPTTKRPLNMTTPTTAPPRVERDAEKGNMTAPTTELPKNATTAKPKQRRDAEEDDETNMPSLPANATDMSLNKTKDAALGKDLEHELEHQLKSKSGEKCDHGKLKGGKDEKKGDKLTEDKKGNKTEPATTPAPSSRRRRSDYGSSEVRLAVRSQPRAVVRSSGYGQRTAVRSRPVAVVREVETYEEDEPIVIREAPKRRKLVRTSAYEAPAVVHDEVELVDDDGYETEMVRAVPAVRSSRYRRAAEKEMAA